MALVPGLGAGINRPVPVDPILAGQRPYVPPTPSTSPPASTPPQMGSRPSNTQYSSVARVVQAYKQNLISYNQAYQILVTQFGFSGNDATDALGVEASTILDPPIEVPEEKPVSDVVSEPEIEVAQPEAAPVFSGVQDFQVIGLVAILGAIYLFRQG